MIRIVLAVFTLLSFVTSGQITSSASASATPDGSIGDTTQLDSLWIAPDFLPIPKNGGWLWYDIANDRAADSVHITDFILPESGFHQEFVVKNDSMWGILSGDGYEIVPFLYDSIIYIDQQLITLSNGVWNYHYQTFSELDGDFGEMIDSLIPISFDSLFCNGSEIYYFDQGKTGMILLNGTVILPKYDGIHPFTNTVSTGFYLTLLGEVYNLLDNSGEELLPPGVWDLRNTEDGVFEFRRDQNPEFYIPYMDEFIRPNGRDVIFYANEGYKIYNEEKTRSEFHLADGRVLKDEYDDYFHLYQDYFAVRLNGKVGLTKSGTELLSELKYDQINGIAQAVFNEGVPEYYFKYFFGDSCGLMNQFGQEVFEANYANIIFTPDPDRFVVLDRRLTGVVDRSGNSIIPIKYDHIYLDPSTKLFVVQHFEKLGLFRMDGTQLLPIEYDLFRSLQSFETGDSINGLFVLKKGGKFYFSNRKGFISGKGFDHFDHTTDILKTYDSKLISIFIFDSTGQVEEKQEYPLYENTIIKRDYWELNYGFKGWEVSELEENQKEGYFGLRFYAKRGMGVKPNYRTIRQTSFHDFIGAVDVESREYTWADDKSTQIIRGFDHLKTGSGTVDNATFFSSDVLKPNRGSGDRYINFELDGTQVRSYAHHNFKTIELSKPILYSDIMNSENNYRRYFVGGSTEICSIENAEISLYDYFTYWNSLDACRVSPELMREILNPKLGVRFVNSETGIINASWLGVQKGMISYESTRYFDAYNYIGWSAFFERQLNAKNGSLKSKYLPKEDEESVVITDVVDAREANALISDYIIAEVKNDQISKIHIDYPNYFFHQDSIDLSYETGRITRRLDSNFVRLITPRGLIVADSCVLVRYLNEERFGVFRSNGWELIDKDGKLITDTIFTSVSEFKNNRAEFGLQGGSAIILNKNGEEMMPLPEKRIFLDDDHYYFASRPGLIFSAVSGMSEEPNSGEKYHSKGFFVSKEDGKTNVRRLGYVPSIKLNTTSKLKTFGNSIYYQSGKNMYSIDPSLKITKHKKVDKFRIVSPDIGWLEGKKDVLIDKDWNTIHTIEKRESFEMQGGDLVILKDDSVLINYGSMRPLTDESQLAIAPPQVKVISENGKYGVQRGEEMLLPPTYAWLSKINDQEFLAKTNSENQLYDSRLNRIGKQPFDRYIQTSGMNFVFFYKNQTYLVSTGDEISNLIE